MKKITTALISVYHKKGLEPVLSALQKSGVRIFSTGGTFDFIKEKGFEAESVESLTSYPSILGGRVKTLHPKVFGGILARRNDAHDQETLMKYQIPEFDLVIVDLYPFEETVHNTTDENTIIEKIDIGGIALLRAAAKNYKDVLVVSSVDQYDELLALLNKNDGASTEDDRHYFAARAFDMSSHYDTAIFQWMNQDKVLSFKQSIRQPHELRYGENPHQKGVFYGDLDKMFEQLHGKAISYNNLQDLDAAVALIDEFDATAFAVLKHNNACGLAVRDTLLAAWKDALAGDPVSAFGGVLITNREVDREVAEEINKLFFEIILAPGYEPEALKILQQKKNRIILKRKEGKMATHQFRTALNGILWQDRDLVSENPEQLEAKTKRVPTAEQVEDLLFANKIVKHIKSNAIVLVKNKQLVGLGTGQTSRVDALKQAIEKAKNFNLSLENSVMASDAFFPFSDSVEIASKAGVTAVIQPGGSIRDEDSIRFCNENDVAMVFTGVRHFKH